MELTVDWRPLVERYGATAVLGWLAPRAVVGAVLGDTELAAAALEALREDVPARAQVLAAFPETLALAAPAPAQIEHDPGSQLPLLDHVATRLLGRKLRSLERRDRTHFQSLSPPAFDALAACTARVLAAGLGPALRYALIHLDIAKTADPTLRAAWHAAGIPLEIHNEAAAAILERTPRALPLSPAHHRLAHLWIAHHGLAGQHVRGETPLAMYGGLVAALRELPELATLALDGLHVIDACDTAAVREGLVDDALLAKLAAVRDLLARAVTGAITLAELAPPHDRASLVTRLAALRASRQAAGEPRAAISEAVAYIEDTELAALLPALATCQLWYCESATAGLAPIAQLKVLAAAVGAARRLGVDVTRPWHAMLKPLVARLHGDSARYRLRLVEAALAPRTIRELVSGGASLGPLGTLSARLAHAADPDAIVIDYVDTAESAALVTLLGLYETRGAVAYHTMLKALCDLYGLRKDELDRVANEANYLATMNAARGDKQRMLDFVRPGRIVEIGPGGGIVLDLLEDRFTDSTIIGVDLSREVVAALAARARANHRRWQVLYGAAEELPALVTEPIDTVVFCSILHEVYSYTEPKFQLASVERVVRAAFATLAVGGRIVIRDGVMPPAGMRRIQMIAPDCRSTFDLFVAQFEGRAIAFRELAPDRVELTTPDAMEFLYTYTWGAASFPYEVRELYGVLPYDDYVAALVAWCGGPSACAVVELPPDLRSYLQAGYRDALAGKIVLTDEHGRPVTLPDSNCIIVLERRA